MASLGVCGALNTSGGGGTPPMARPTRARQAPRAGAQGCAGHGISSAGTLWGPCRDTLGTHCSVPTALPLCLPRTGGQQGDKVQSVPPPHEPPRGPAPAPQAIWATRPTPATHAWPVTAPPSPRSPLQLKQLFYFGARGVGRRGPAFAGWNHPSAAPTLVSAGVNRWICLISLGRAPRRRLQSGGAGCYHPSHVAQGHPVRTL